MVYLLNAHIWVLLFVRIIGLLIIIVICLGCLNSILGCTTIHQDTSGVCTNLNWQLKQGMSIKHQRTVHYCIGWELMLIIRIERLSFYILNTKEKSATMYAEQLNKFKLK